ncbi:hypothetical protein ACIQ4I_19410 [Rummeliibacillus sp. NPDC094406]|uniref:hypothetical protein n=1 Tax=Rummeliibacillus sp. NPDC094406 TaxID=3364511 RepID=UPI0037FB3D28
MLLQHCRCNIRRINTQPVMELRAFGFAVAIVVLVDTFLVRPIVIPALIVILDKFGY